MEHPLVSRLIGILEDPSNTLSGTLSGDLVRGYSAYEIARQNGYTGTVRQWLSSLVGESGKTPVITATKESGITSIFADDTLIAMVYDGEDGAKGDPGEKGDTPVITATKQNGVTAIFADNVQIATINDGMDGAKGDPGDDYILTQADMATIASLVDVIDDTSSALDKTWSAGKIESELSNAGSVKDVTINGTSVLDNETGEANIPYANNSTRGVVRTLSAYGTGALADGTLRTNPSDSATVKAGTHEYQPVVPSIQHESSFYGLAKAAGDTTQSQSANAVGTYTPEAALAIRNMIGATGESASITVVGTDPVIQASSNARYICGEVATLDFTPSATGICEVIFTSGTTPTVLTLPQTVQFPEWFAVEASHTYEISVIDGTYGAVMVW